MPPKPKRKTAAEPRIFDVQAFLESTGVARRVVEFESGQGVFRQGDVADTVFYIQDGAVRLSVVSKAGKEAVVALLGAGDFFGEGALTGASLRLGHATAAQVSRILVIDRDEMSQRLKAHEELSTRFIAFLLARNSRTEADLVDQLFNSSEKRLARALLLLARYGTHDESHRTIPRISQEVLAEMVGTTRSRVNFFMNKFRKLGLIEYNGAIKVHESLLDIVLHD